MSLHPKPRDTDQVRTEDPIELSSRVIDEAAAHEPTNRVTNLLTEIDDDIAIVESFSHMIVFRTDAGLVSFDASGEGSGVAVMEALRGWRDDPVHSLVYTHGHMDHVGGSGAVVADAEAHGHDTPTVVSHVNLPPRLERYQYTNAWNQIINKRQFGGVNPRHGMRVASETPQFVPEDAAWPDITYEDALTLAVGGLEVQLHHAKGETDDHTWAWVPEHKALVTGDLVLWVFPNAGNPQKVQRFPSLWAQALRTMMSFDAELLLPAHGLPIRGHDRIQRVLGDLAGALEGLERDTVAMMNEGARLDEIIHAVRVDPDKLSLPWMIPVYDEPEFVVRNIWRMYGGWWDANPSHLKPAPETDLASELAALAGGADVLARRAQELSEAGDFRLAAHLIDFAGLAAPDDAAIHGARSELYMARRKSESSLMSKGIFAAAARESQAVAEADGAD
jgi:alkyl sulfatase BDS1-like metallo-beta-lactamase superfamily hydrolase